MLEVLALSQEEAISRYQKLTMEGVTHSFLALSKLELGPSQLGWLENTRML
jgi:hypothetical protein